MRPFLSLLLLTAFAGCVNYSCTLIGCNRGLRVNLATQPTSPFRVEASSGDGTGTHTYDCPDITRCSTEAFLEDYLPTEATITVTYEGRTRTTVARPQYEVSYPNGRRCGPECTQGLVTIALP